MTDPSFDHESTYRTPRWVKILGIVVVILVAVFVIVHLAGGGLGNHMPSGGSR